jgi:hypothetical protein
MADQHDKSKKNDKSQGKDKPPVKPFDINLEIPSGKRKPDEVADVQPVEEGAEVFDVTEVVEEPPANVETVEAVEDVMEVVEEPAHVVSESPSGTSKVEIVEDVSEVGPQHAEEKIEEVVEVVEEVDEVAEPPAAEAKPPKGGKTMVANRGGVSTMLAGKEGEHLPGQELGGPVPAAPKTAKPVRESKEVQHVSDAGKIHDDVIEAVGAPDSGTRPHKAGEEDDVLEVLDIVEAMPSSGNLSDVSLVEKDDEEGKPSSKRLTKTDSDKTDPFGPGAAVSGERPSKRGVNDQMDGVDNEDEDVLVEGASEVDLGKRPGRKADPQSGVDIIAEALESGVDIDSDQPVMLPPGRKQRKSESQLDLAHEKAEDVDSSSIDLGSSAQQPALPSLPPPRQAKHHIEEEDDLVSAEEALDNIDDSAVMEADSAEIESLEDEAPGAPKGPKPAAQVDADEHDEVLVQPGRRPAVEVAEGDEVVVEPKSGRMAAAAQVEGEEEQLATPRGKGSRKYEDADKQARLKQHGRFLPFVTGGLLAAVLVVVGAGAAWYFNLLPDSPNAPKKTAQASKVVSTNIPDELKPLFEEYEKLTKDGAPAGDKLNDMLKKSEEVGGKDLAQVLKNLVEERTKVAKLDEANSKSDKALLKVSKDNDALKSKADELAAANKKLEVNLAAEKGFVKDLGKSLEAARKDVKDGEKLIADINSALKKAGTKDTGIKGVEDLATGREILNTAIANAVKELKDGNYLVDDPDVSKKLVESIKKARLAGQSPLGSSLGQMMGALGNMSKTPGDWVKKAFDTAKLQQELKIAQAKEVFAEKPEKRLDTMIALLADRNHKSATAVDGYTRYTDWVRQEESKSSPQAKARALYVDALILRNKEDFDAARKALDHSLAAAKGLKGDAALEAAVAQSLKELTDPSAYYLPRVAAKLAMGQGKEALDELNVALKVMPDQPQLLLKRAQATFEIARASDKLDAETQKKIRDDAEAARKDKTVVAESFYLVGRLDETNRDWPGAEKNYRQAIAAVGDGPAGARYRVALAKVLQRERAAAGEGGESDKAGGSQESGVLPRAGDAHSDLDGFSFTGVAYEQQDEDDFAAQKRLKESMEIANKLIKSDDPKTRGEGYMLLGAAQAKLGKRNEGLLNYIKGLELVLPGAETQDLAKIVNSHPAFRQSDLAGQINPQMSERHFAKGLEFFWAKKYLDAENEFKKAVTYFSEDARYYYFLGMSRLLQKEREKLLLAEYDFELGVQLEIARKPATQAINASLERIQGELRRVLNSKREKVATAG